MTTVERLRHLNQFGPDSVNSRANSGAHAPSTWQEKQPLTRNPLNHTTGPSVTYFFVTSRSKIFFPLTNTCLLSREGESLASRAESRKGSRVLRELRRDPAAEERHRRDRDDRDESHEDSVLGERCSLLISE
jgi:hypothetical protein